VRYNLSKNQRGGGLEFGFGAGSVTGTVTENTLFMNGYNSAGVPSPEALNVAFYSPRRGHRDHVLQQRRHGERRPGVVVRRLPAS
jgi:hypothetical protein